MSRLLTNPPETGIKTQKISDTQHAIWNVTADMIGLVDKLDEGWTLEDGTRFDQEQDAIAQLAEDRGLSIPRKPKKKKEPKVHSVKEGKRFYTLGGFKVDVMLDAYKPFSSFRVLETEDEVILQGSKTATGKWQQIGVAKK